MALNAAYKASTVASPSGSECIFDTRGYAVFTDGGIERLAKLPKIFARIRGSKNHVLSSNSKGRPKSFSEIAGAPISNTVNPVASNWNLSTAFRNSKFGWPCKCLREHFFRFSLGCLITVTRVCNLSLFIKEKYCVVLRRGSIRFFGMVCSLIARQSAKKWHYW